MKALDSFVQGPLCIVLLAAIALTSVFALPAGGRLTQLAIWAGAFAFPVLAYVMIRRLRGADLGKLGMFARYPGFSIAALFLVQACGLYKVHPGAIHPDAFIGTAGLYLMFAILTVVP